jgi:hypothetical protein
VAVDGAPQAAAERAPEAATQVEPPAPEEARPAADGAPVLDAYDYPHPLKPTLPEPDEGEGPEGEAGTGGSVKPTPVDDEGPTLEEIIARAEAQQALFGEAFEGDVGEGPEEPEEDGAAKA